MMSEANRTAPEPFERTRNQGACLEQRFWCDWCRVPWCEFAPLRTEIPPCPYCGGLLTRRNDPKDPH